MKRVLDILLAGAGLILLSPLLLGLAVAIKLTSRGPAIFRQRRIGRGGLEFTLLKLRTMTVSEAAEKGSFEAGSTARVTPIGVLLRKTKLDELPQLLNVLIGDMSLVGPRPEVRKWVEAYPERWARIHTIRPGITDPASIVYRDEEALLASSEDPERIYREEVLPHKLDLYEQYVRRHNLATDLRLILQTAFVVLFRRSAPIGLHRSRVQPAPVDVDSGQRNGPLRILPLERRHLGDVVDIHMGAFPGFFLTFLGRGFLREFYGSFLTDLEGIAFVAEDEGGQAVGVVVGPRNPAGYFKRLLKRRWWRFCLASLLASVRRPGSIPRLFRALLYRGDSPDGPPRALLSSLAVKPQRQGEGVGRRLLAAWVTEARRRCVPGCFLVTDAHDNDAVNRFYRRNGWRLEASYVTPQGRSMNRYVLDFPRRTAPGR